MKLYRIPYVLELLCLVIIAGCGSDEISSPLPDDGEIKPGDPVMFTTYVPVRAMTRYADAEEFNAEMAKYKTTTENYAFTYYIYKYGVEGSLALGSQLFWPDNTQAYGFKAIAGTETLDNNQSTKANYLLQDRLEGFGYEPIWSGSAPVDNIDGLNYRTCVEWKAANAGRGVDAADQKKIPLYLKHKRSRITVILKAGAGVRREELLLNAASTNIAATIYSYGTPDLNITPYAYEELIESVYYTHYTAIVEPHNYTSHNIVTINLSGQSVTFSGSYDISEEGKHLILTLTLTRDDSFKVLVTAQVTDWVDDTTTKTLDDFNQEIN